MLTTTWLAFGDHSKKTAYQAYMLKVKQGHEKYTTIQTEKDTEKTNHGEK